MPQNNPAGRLLDLVLAGDNIGNSTQVPIRDAWRRILDVERGDDAALMRRLAQVYELPEAIRREITMLDDVPADLLLREMTKVDAALQLPLTDAWQSFRSRVDATTRYSLEVISDVLARRAPEPELTTDQLADLLGNVRSLLDDVLTADLPADLREFLARHLQAMEQAIEEVRIRGADALRDAAEAIIGGVVIRSQTVGAPKDETGNTFWKKLISVAAGVLVLLNVGKGTLELGQEVYKALPVASAEHKPDATRSDKEEKGP